MIPPKVLFFFGPPGSGKSTQGMRVAERLGMHHFETSRILEEEFAGNGGASLLTIDGKEYPIQEEQRKYAAGEMVTPAVTTYFMHNALRRLADEDRHIVFCGSPRTLFEAERLFPFLEELFGLGSIRVIMLFVRQQTAVYRLQNRRVCAQCGFPHPWRTETKHLATCVRCYGILHKRGSIDGPDAIPRRFHVYEEETMPAIAFAEGRGYPFAVIDGEPHEDLVESRILDILPVMHESRIAESA